MAPAERQLYRLPSGVALATRGDAGISLGATTHAGTANKKRPRQVGQEPVTAECGALLPYAKKFNNPRPAVN